MKHSYQLPLCVAVAAFCATAASPPGRNKLARDVPVSGTANLMVQYADSSVEAHAGKWAGAGAFSSSPPPP